jgi:hypothetical protein
MPLDIPDVIRLKMRAGLLPVASEEIRVRTALGSGQPCNACDRTVSPAQFECALDGPAGTPLRFHKPCFETWKRVSVPE